MSQGLVARRLGLAAALLALAGAAAAECQVNKAAQLKYQLEGNQISVAGEINGHAIRLLLDTAAPGTMVTAPGARDLGLAVADDQLDRDMGGVGRAALRVPVGQVAVEQMKFDRFALKGAKLTVRSQRANFGSPDLVGLLGADLLRQFDIDFDLAHGAITLLQPKDCAGRNLAYWSDSYNVLELSAKGKALVTTVKVNGQDAVAVLDSGSPFTGVTSQAAKRLGIDGGDAETPPERAASDYFTLTYDVYNGFATERRNANVVSEGALHDSGGGPIRIMAAKADSLQLDQETVKPAPLKIYRFAARQAETGSHFSDQSAYPEDLLLGVDFLLSHHVLLSHSQNRIYFSYVGGAVFQGTTPAAAP